MVKTAAKKESMQAAIYPGEVDKDEITITDPEEIKEFFRELMANTREETKRND